MPTGLHPDRNFDTIAARATGFCEGLAALCAGTRAWPIDVERIRTLEQLAAAGQLCAAHTLAAGPDGIAVHPLRSWLNEHATDTAPALVWNENVGPYLARPLQMGADLVVENPSCWTPGTGDGGARCMLVARSEKVCMQVETLMGDTLAGGAPDELAAFTPSLATLSSVTQRRSDTALVTAHYLAAHPKIARVSHPGLESDPANDAARRTLEHGFGPLVAFYLAEGTELTAEDPTASNCRTSSVTPLPGTDGRGWLLSCGLESPLDVVGWLEGIVG